MENFEIALNCNAGGKPHTHTIFVQAGSGSVYGVGPPTRVRLRYTCPKTKEALMATFEPPRGAARPFTITKVD